MSSKCQSSSLNLSTKIQDKIWALEGINLQKEGHPTNVINLKTKKFICGPHKIRFWLR